MFYDSNAQLFKCSIVLKSQGIKARRRLGLEP